MRLLVDFFATVVAKVAIELIGSHTGMVLAHHVIHVFETIVLPVIR